MMCSDTDGRTLSGSSRELRTRVAFLSVVYFSRGILGEPCPKKGKRTLLGDLEKHIPFAREELARQMGLPWSWYPCLVALSYTGRPKRDTVAAF